jgi:hypothetical protein
MKLFVAGGTRDGWPCVVVVVIGKKKGRRGTAFSLA